MDSRSEEVQHLCAFWKRLATFHFATGTFFGVFWLHQGASWPWWTWIMMGILTIANHYIFYRAGLNVWWLTDYLNHPQLSEVDWFGVLELKRKAILWGYGSSTTSSSTSGEVVVEEEGRREK